MGCITGTTVRKVLMSTVEDERRSSVELQSEGTEMMFENIYLRSGLARFPPQALAGNGELSSQPCQSSSIPLWLLNLLNLFYQTD